MLEHLRLDTGYKILNVNKEYLNVCIEQVKQGDSSRLWFLVELIISHIHQVDIIFPLIHSYSEYGISGRLEAFLSVIIVRGSQCHDFLSPQTTTSRFICSLVN